jgi:hypothetical protein
MRRDPRLTPTLFTLAEVEKIEDLADRRVDAAMDFVLFAFVIGAVIGAAIAWLSFGWHPWAPAHDAAFRQVGLALGQALQLIP